MIGRPRAAQKDCDFLPSVPERAAASNGAGCAAGVGAGLPFRPRPKRLSRSQISRKVAKNAKHVRFTFAPLRLCVSQNRDLLRLQDLCLPGIDYLGHRQQPTPRGVSIMIVNYRIGIAVEKR